MCGRFWIEDWVINEAMDISDLVDEEIKEKEYNQEVFPSNSVPVIEASNDKKHLTEITWGYPKIKGSGLMINARSETVTEKQSFRNGIFNNRIIIPADSYYEWNAHKEKVNIHKKDKQIVFMAGIYDEFEGEKKFVILTTKPNKSVDQIHDRMPLILEEDQIDKWLFDNNSTDDLLIYEPVPLEFYQEIEQINMFK